jgi:hypothetical protein
MGREVALRTFVVVASILLAGCGGPQTVQEPQEKPADLLTVDDHTLPNATVGIAYDFSLHAEGGRAPLTWEASKRDMPGGLRLNADGLVQGTPNEAGTFTFQVEATDAEGQGKQALMTLGVELAPNLVRCGDTASGRFEGSSWGPEGVDWAEFGSYAWIDLMVPDEYITKVELDFNLTSATVYQGLPGEPSGSHDLEGGYEVVSVSEDNGLVIDLATDPGLASYHGQIVIPLLVVGNSINQDWSVEVTCTDNPIFRWLWMLPTRLGEEIDTDYDIIGDDEGVRIWTEDPLPEWVTLEEDGRMVGTAMEPGGWDFTIHAEDSEGRHTEAETMLGVYDVTDVACGDVVELTVEEGMFEGEFTGAYDPRGYEVLSLPYSADFSAVELTLTGSDSKHLGIPQPYPVLPYYANGTYLYDYSFNPTELDIDTRSFPAWSNFADDGEMYIVAAPLYAADPVTLDIHCDSGPRTDMRALPVLRPDEHEIWPLYGAGGVTPYVWEAVGGPAEADFGTSLRTVPLDPGSYSVDLTITDDATDSRTDNYDLWVGEEAACRGVEMISCDDNFAGTFTEVYYMDNGFTEASTRTFCYVPRYESALYFAATTAEDTELLVSLSQPAVSEYDFLYQYATAWRGYAEEFDTTSITLNDEGWPNLADFRDLPTLISVQAAEPGGWSFRMTCF